ncbi:MAG: amino acid ABC transporter substrate-binding protein [Rhodobiaceae bacterium]|nr:MAG: amino acid ABC transporter substrate-binding protein [Rhodobiaceae bacterium]
MSRVRTLLRHAGAVFACIALVWAFVSQAHAKVENDMVYLGAAISLTGKYSTNGAHTQRGYDLAIERINAEGGVIVDGKTYKLAIIYYDDESTPARGAQLAERLIQQDGVTFILGPYSSGLTRAMAPIIEKYGIPMVEANGASISLFEEGYKYLFAVLSTTEQYLQGAVALAAQTAGDGEGLRVALAMENDPFSQDVRTGVIADAEHHGMRVIIDDKLPPDLSDLAATLAKVRVLKPDLLVVSGHAKGAALAIRQIADGRVDVPMLALTHCDAAQIIEKFGEKAEYALCASQWAPGLSYSDPLFGSASDFATLFEETYGYAPPYQAAESAAAVMVFADAFERAGTFDTLAVRDALSATDLMTFYGRIDFDEAGRNIAKPMVLYQVQDGKFRVVYPAEFAEAPFRHPTPRWADR